MSGILKCRILCLGLATQFAGKYDVSEETGRYLKEMSEGSPMWTSLGEEAQEFTAEEAIELYNTNEILHTYALDFVPVSLTATA